MNPPPGPQTLESKAHVGTATSQQPVQILTFCQAAIWLFLLNSSPQVLLPKVLSSPILYPLLPSTITQVPPALDCERHWFLLLSHSIVAVCSFMFVVFFTVEVLKFMLFSKLKGQFEEETRCPIKSNTENWEVSSQAQAILVNQYTKSWVKVHENI